MEKLNFSTGEIISKAWAIFKEKWTQIFGIGALYMVLSSVAGGLVSGLQNSDLAGLTVIASIGVQIFTLFLSIGMMKLMLAVVRNQQINFADLFGGAQYLLQYFLGSLVVGFITMLGFLLLIVPGVIWSLKYMFVLFLIVDEGLEYSAAMKESEKMTNGIKMQLFGFNIMIIGLNFLGMLALFIGLIVTIPVSCLASYVLYTHLRSQMIGQSTPAEVTAVQTPTEAVLPPTEQPTNQI